MTWSQTFVVTWLQFALGAAVVLQSARFLLGRVAQPADRIRLIQWTFVAVLALPLLGTLAPLPVWRLGLVRPTAGPAESANPSGAGSQLLIGTQTSGAWTGSEVDGALELGNVASTGSTAAGAPSNANPTVAPKTTSWWQGTRVEPWLLVACVIAGLHVAMLVFLLLEWGIGRWRLARMCRAAVPASLAVDRVWNELAQGAGSHVRLLVTPLLEVPLVFGWRRPVILVPRNLAAEGGATLRLCLAHEWSHIERGDIVTWRWIGACQFLLWLYPAYWVLRKELGLCQDLLADRRATHAGDEVVEYSELLVGLARRRMAGRMAGALAFADQPAHLTRRIRMLLDSPIPVRTLSSWRFSLTAATVVLSVALLASLIRLEGAAADAATESTAVDATGSTSQPAIPSADPVPALKYACLVVDRETGQKISNAHVTVRRSILTSSEHRLLAESHHTTDSSGTYELIIPPEQVAERALYIELDVEHDQYAARRGFGYALGMIRRNEALGERPFFERTELEAGDSVTGTVLAPDGQPLAGTTVYGFSRPNESKPEASWSSTKTAADGTFRLVLHKEGDALLGVIPGDFAIVEKYLAGVRGDLGAIHVAGGVRCEGQTLDAEGQPIPGLAVNIVAVGPRDPARQRMPNLVRHGTISDAEGHFAFDPLPAGEYRLSVNEHINSPWAMDRKIYPNPSVFLPAQVTLKDSDDIVQQELRTVPHVMLRAQYFDSAGQTTRGHAFFIGGNLRDRQWSAMGRPDEHGAIHLQVPRGLENGWAHLMTNEHSVLRFRMGREAPLRTAFEPVHFGALDHDVNNFEIVRYNAPIVLISASDSSNKPIENLQVRARYDRLTIHGGLDEGSSIVSFERQGDGRYRSAQLLPDEDVTVTVSADGYETSSQQLNLKEGVVRELSITLRGWEAGENQ